MVFIRKIQKATGNSALLEDVEKRHTLRHGETVVVVTVDDEHGGIPLQDVFRGGGVPEAIVVAVVPVGTVVLHLVSRHSYRPTEKGGHTSC